MGVIRGTQNGGEMSSGERRYLPRKLSLDALVDELVKEHAVMRGGIRRAREAAARRDFGGVKAELQRIDPVFRQHIADEESTVLGFLIRELSKAGAEEEIRVFQQHRPIYQLMKKVAEMAAMSSADLESNQADLDSVFDLHTKAEETRVFPRTLSLRK